MNIDKVLKKYGVSVFLTGEDGWQSPIFRAFIQPLRYKTKLYMEGEHTPIGINRNDVYLYIGPADHDLTKLNITHRIHDKDNNKYMIDRAERINLNDKTVYIWAVIRKTTEVNI